MKKLCKPTPKTFLKMAGKRMHTPHLTPLDPPLAISYRNHQKSMAYFSHLGTISIVFFTKKQSQKGGHGPIPPLNTLLPSSYLLDSPRAISYRNHQESQAYFSHLHRLGADTLVGKCTIIKLGLNYAACTLSAG